MRRPQDDPGVQQAKAVPGNLEPSWHQIEVQQRENMEKYVSNEPTFSLGKNHNWQGCACRSWKKKECKIRKKIKNRSKIEAQDGWLLGIRF